MCLLDTFILALFTNSSINSKDSLQYKRNSWVYFLHERGLTQDYSNNFFSCCSFCSQVSTLGTKSNRKAAGLKTQKCCGNENIYYISRLLKSIPWQCRFKATKIDYYSFIPTLPNFLRYWFCNLNILKCVCMGVFCTIPYNWEKKKKWYVHYRSYVHPWKLVLRNGHCHIAIRCRIVFHIRRYTC